MKNQNLKIEQEVEKTLNSYSKVQKPVLNSYFVVKLKAKMQANQVQKNPKMSLTFKWAFAFFILLINTLIIFNYLNNSVKVNSDQNMYSVIQSEYNVDATDLYAENLADFNRE